MLKKKITAQKGFTIIELTLVVGVIAMVMFASISVVLVDAQRGWNRMYERTYSDVTTDSYVARKTFDRVIRQASGGRFLLDDAGNWIEVYSYADSNSAVVDRYARFFYEGDGQLNVEYGKLNPRETTSIHTVCENVSNCSFTAIGRSAQIILTLDKDSQTATVTSSSVMQNP